MTTKLKEIIEEKLQKAASQLVVDIVISHNETQEDIDAGVYEPKNKMSSILNLDLVLVPQVVQKANNPIKTKK